MTSETLFESWKRLSSTRHTRSSTPLAPGRRSRSSGPRPSASPHRGAGAIGGRGVTRARNLRVDVRASRERSSDTNVFALVGPTASGKTEVSLQLARRLKAEILVVDSMTVYRGMDIGTAKPSPAQRGQIPHHLIDVADPAQPFSVAQFQTIALRALGDVTGR